jgi:nucleoside-diphosphate-sugar epimerase
MGHIAITGACGFLGRAFAARALARGQRITGLDTSAAGGGVWAAEGARLIQGDITDPAAADALCAGADLVVHTAAVVREDGPWSLFEHVNVGGTACLLAAARRAAVRDFVHVSSVMVHGFDYPDDVAEDGPLGGWDNPYCATKIGAERVALAAHDPGRLDVFVIRPGDVYGPGSIPWTQRPARMMQERRWIYVDSEKSLLNHVHIDNLLDGVDCVLAARRSGTPFCVTDDARTSARAFFSYYQRHLGIRYIPEVPGPLAEGAASVLARLAGVLGREAELNREAVRYVRRRGKYSIEKLKSLGYRPRIGLPEGMAQSLDWLTAQGIGPRG